MEEVVRAFNYLIDQGLIYYWGEPTYLGEHSSWRVS